MGRGANQSGQSAPHQIAFDASDSHERVRHRRSPSVEAVLRVGRRSGHVGAEVLVEAATERTGVIRRGTHTGALLVAYLTALHGVVVVAVAMWSDGDGAARGDGAVEGEAYGLGGG